MLINELISNTSKVKKWFKNFTNIPLLLFVPQFMKITQIRPFTCSLSGTMQGLII